MTNTKFLIMDTVFNNSTEAKTAHSFKPSIQQHWFMYTISSFSILLAFTKFGVNTITGICMLSIGSFFIVYCILSVSTTKYIITQQEILVRKGPFSRKFKGLAYGDINNISVRQRRMQKLLKIGNLVINTNQFSRIFRGIKNPHKIKELINREKSSAYERRTLLRKIL